MQQCSDTDSIVATAFRYRFWSGHSSQIQTKELPQPSNTVSVATALKYSFSGHIPQIQFQWPQSSKFSFSGHIPQIQFQWPQPSNTVSVATVLKIQFQWPQPSNTVSVATSLKYRPKRGHSPQIHTQMWPQPSNTYSKVATALRYCLSGHSPQIQAQSGCSPQIQTLVDQSHLLTKANWDQTRAFGGQ